MIKKHYIDDHNFDSNNYFFEGLFSPDNKFYPGKCFRCEEAVQLNLSQYPK